jgi:hypothetical protein
MGIISSLPINTKTIDELPVADTLADADRLVVSQAGGDGKVALATLKQSIYSTETAAAITQSISDNSNAITVVEQKVNQKGGRNRIINGGFDIWQRSLTQTDTGYGSDDRWYNGNLGSTKTHTQETFTLGQTDVVSNPRFFSRTDVTSVAGVGNYANKSQRVENVGDFSGETVTLSFWAKADAAKDIAVEFLQDFGIGVGSSADVNALGVTLISLTTSWTQFTVTVTLPSIAGKTITATNVSDAEVNSDFTEVLFWFDAGSDFNARTGSLGQQSGVFDIGDVQLETGNYATPFEFRSEGDVLRDCFAFFYVEDNKVSNPTIGLAAQYTSSAAYYILNFPVTMRSYPTTAFSAGNDFEFFNNGVASTSTTATLNNTGRFRMELIFGVNQAQGVATYFRFTAGGIGTKFLRFEAELY